MTDDNIFREVEQDLRQEQLKAYWDKFGVYFIAVALIIVGSVAGYTGWTSWSKKQAATAGESFSQAQALVSEGKGDEAAKAFEKLMKDGPKGYRVLSMFQVASAKAAEGKPDEAVKVYDELAKDQDIDHVLKGFAQIQSSLIRLDHADFGEMKTRLEGMAVAGNPWRHSARELLGLAAYKEGNLEVAQKYYEAVLADPEAKAQTPGAPRDLVTRAGNMLALIIEAKADRDAQKGALDSDKSSENPQQSDEKK